MGRKFKITFATGSRADYGIVRNYITKLSTDSEIDFSILATGSLSSEKYGKAIDIIKEDGFKIDYIHNIEQRVSNISDTVSIMANVLNMFNNYFSEHSYDMIIILGDRYEIYSVAIAAAMHRIPILHIHGGEITLANYDEFIRHSITKMAQFHFTSTEEYRKRVIQLGEQPDTVFNLGALGAENCQLIDINNVPQELIGINNVFAVLYHPETLNAESPGKQIDEVLAAIVPYVNDYKFVFIGSNADTQSDQIVEKIITFCKSHDGCFFYRNLHPDAFHHLVKKSFALIGNSSSGIIEVPSLGTYTINIGDRQTGRVRGKSVIDVRCDSHEISKAIQYAIANKDTKIEADVYSTPDTANLYYRKTKEIIARLNTLGYKEFYDINY